MIKLGQKLIVATQRSDFGRHQGLIIGLQSPDGGFSYVKGPVTFEPHDEQTMLTDPTFEGPLVTELLQAALDEAWRLGMRPTDYREERPEQIVAMDNHLQDMRRLVFADKPTTT